jgi:hypothetical protein
VRYNPTRELYSGEVPTYQLQYASRAHSDSPTAADWAAGLSTDNTDWTTSDPVAGLEFAFDAANNKWVANVAGLNNNDYAFRVKTTSTLQPTALISNLGVVTVDNLPHKADAVPIAITQSAAGVQVSQNLYVSQFPIDHYTFEACQVTLVDCGNPQNWTKSVTASLADGKASAVFRDANALEPNIRYAIRMRVFYSSTDSVLDPQGLWDVAGNFTYNWTVEPSQTASDTISFAFKVADGYSGFDKGEYTPATWTGIIHHTTVAVDGTDYVVSVDNSPAGQVCNLTSATGVIACTVTGLTTGTHNISINGTGLVGNTGSLSATIGTYTLVAPNAPTVAVADERAYPTTGTPTGISLTVRFTTATSGTDGLGYAVEAYANSDPTTVVAEAPATCDSELANANCSATFTGADALNSATTYIFKAVAARAGATVTSAASPIYKTAYKPAALTVTTPAQNGPTSFNIGSAPSTAGWTESGYDATGANTARSFSFYVEQYDVAANDWACVGSVGISPDSPLSCDDVAVITSNLVTRRATVNSLLPGAIYRFHIVEASVYDFTDSASTPIWISTAPDFKVGDAIGITGVSDANGIVYNARNITFPEVVWDSLGSSGAPAINAEIGYRIEIRTHMTNLNGTANIGAWTLAAGCQLTPGADLPANLTYDGATDTYTCQVQNLQAQSGYDVRVTPLSAYGDGQALVEEPAFATTVNVAALGIEQAPEIDNNGNTGAVLSWPVVDGVNYIVKLVDDTIDGDDAINNVNVPALFQSTAADDNALAAADCQLKTASASGDRVGNAFYSSGVKYIVCHTIYAYTESAGVVAQARIQSGTNYELVVKAIPNSLFTDIAGEVVKTLYTVTQAQPVQDVAVAETTGCWVTSKPAGAAEGFCAYTPALTNIPAGTFLPKLQMSWTPLTAAEANIDVSEGTASVTTVGGATVVATTAIGYRIYYYDLTANPAGLPLAEDGTLYYQTDRENLSNYNLYDCPLDYLDAVNTVTLGDECNNKITAFAQGHQYIFAVTAVNAGVPGLVDGVNPAGATSHSINYVTTSSVLPAPTNVNLVQTGANELTLTFELPVGETFATAAPEIAGSVLYRNVWTSEADYEWMSTSVDISAASCTSPSGQTPSTCTATISDFAPDYSYKFSVSLENARGESAPADSNAVLTVAQPHIENYSGSGAPVVQTKPANPQDSANVQVKWDEPATTYPNGNPQAGIITSYAVYALDLDARADNLADTTWRTTNCGGQTAEHADCIAAADAEAYATAKTITVDNPARNLTTPYNIYTVDGTTRSVNFNYNATLDNSLTPATNYQFVVVPLGQFSSPSIVGNPERLNVGVIRTAAYPALLSNPDDYTFSTNLSVGLQLADAVVRPQDEVLNYKAFALGIPSTCTQYMQVQGDGSLVFQSTAVQSLPISSTCTDANHTYSVGGVPVTGRVNYANWQPAVIQGNTVVVENVDSTYTYYVVGLVKSDYYNFTLNSGNWNTVTVTDGTYIGKYAKSIRPDSVEVVSVAPVAGSNTATQVTFKQTSAADMDGVTYDSNEIYYRAKYRRCGEADSAWQTSVTPMQGSATPSDNLMMTVNNLRPNTCYEFSIVAYAQATGQNAGNGVGAQSAASDITSVHRYITTGLSLPVAPTTSQSLTAVDAVNIVWEPASLPANLTDDREAIITYNVDKCQGAPTTCTSIATGVVANSYTATGLSSAPSDSYWFRVTPVMDIFGGTATNPELVAGENYTATGTSQTSDMFSLLSNLVAPAMVEVTQAVPPLASEDQVAAGTVRLTWTAATIAGTYASQIGIKYAVECQVGAGLWNACTALAGTVDLSATTTTVSGLVPGQDYRFRIVATTSAFNLSATSATSGTEGVDKLVLSKKIDAGTILPTNPPSGGTVTASWNVPPTLSTYASWDKPTSPETYYEVSAISTATNTVVEVQTSQVTLGAANNESAFPTTGWEVGTYCFTYRIHTAAGYGRPSACGGLVQVGDIIHEEPPAAPKNVQVKVKNNYWEIVRIDGGIEYETDEGIVTWEANSYTGSTPIDHFFVRWGEMVGGEIVTVGDNSGDPIQCAGTAGGSSAACEFNLTGITTTHPGTMYKVEVVAVGNNDMASTPGIPQPDPRTGASFVTKSRFTVQFDSETTGLAAPNAIQVPYSEPLSQTQVQTVNSQTVAMEDANLNNGIFLGWEIGITGRYWKFIGEAVDIMPANNIVLHARWYNFPDRTAVCSAAAGNGDQPDNNNVFNGNALPNGATATRDDACQTVGRLLSIDYKNGQPLHLPQGITQVDLDAGDRITISGRGFAAGQQILLGLVNLDGNSIVNDGAISGQSLSGQALTAQSVSPQAIDSSRFSSCTATGGLLPCWVTADNAVPGGQNVLNPVTVRIPLDTPAGSYYVHGMVQATANSGSAHGFVPVPVVTAKGEKLNTLASRIRVSVDVNSATSGGTDPTNPTDPNNPGGGSSSAWACWLDNAWTIHYNTPTDCEAHDGQWTMPGAPGTNGGTGGNGGNGGSGSGSGDTNNNYNYYNTDGSGSSGGTVTVAGPVVVSGGGTSSAPTPVNVSPIISGGSNNVTVTPPQVDNSGQVYYPTVAQYCTSAEYANPEECVAAGHTWVDKAGAQAGNTGLFGTGVDVFWILLLMLLLFGLGMLLFYFLYRKRREEELRPVFPMFPAQPMYSAEEAETQEYNPVDAEVEE